MKQIPSREASSHPDSQEILRLLWKPIVHCGVQKSLPLVTVLILMHQATHSPSIPVTIHNILYIHFSLPRSFQRIRPSPMPYETFRNKLLI
jgi:hypothetical protein